MVTRLFVLFILMLSNFCMAENNDRCTEDILQLIRAKLNYPTLNYRKYEYGSFVAGDQIISGVCKVWPKDSLKTIVAIAYYEEGHVQTGGDEDLYDKKHYILAIVNSSQSKLISSYQWDANDEIGTNSLSIDTARYDIAAGVRAFGLDISEQYHPHSVNGGLGAYRTLFIQEGEIIKPVLKDFRLSEWDFVVESMVSTWSHGNKSIRNISYTISIGKNVTNGLRNLEVTKSITYDPDTDSEEIVNIPKNESKLLKTLHFNGKEYQ